MRGYCAIGVYSLKNGSNLGTLWRTAQAFDADMLYTIGARYRHQASDTTKAIRHIPYIPYPDFPAFQDARPMGGKLVVVEVDGKHELSSYVHPEQAVYLLGPEDGDVPKSIRESVVHESVRIDSRYCLNVATAGALVLYDRARKATV